MKLIMLVVTRDSCYLRGRPLDKTKMYYYSRNLPLYSKCVSAVDPNTSVAETCIVWLPIGSLFTLISCGSTP